MTGVVTLENLREYRNDSRLSQSFLKGVLNNSFIVEQTLPMVLGSVLDTKLFLPHLVEEMYEVGEFKRPSSAMVKILKKLPKADSLEELDPNVILQTCKEQNYLQKLTDPVLLARVLSEGAGFYKYMYSDKEVITPEEDQLTDLQVKLLREGKSKHILNKSVSQVPLFGTYNGFGLKGLLDLMYVGTKVVTITDLKRSEGNFKDFKYIARNNRYDLQMSFYHYLASQNFPNHTIKCQFLVIDNNNQINLLEVDEKDILIGAKGLNRIRTFNYNEGVDFKEEETIRGWEDAIDIYKQAKQLKLKDFNVEGYYLQNKYQFSIWE